MGKYTNKKHKEMCLCKIAIIFGLEVWLSTQGPGINPSITK